MNDSTINSARVYDSNWQSGRNFKTRRGWRVEDIRAPDNLVEPFVSSLGDYTWRDKIATVYEARRTGNQFLPLPGPYQLSPGEIARGGSTVRVTDTLGDSPLLGLGNSVVASGISLAQEASIPFGAYGRSVGQAQGSTTGGEYSARMVGLPRGSGIGLSKRR